MEFSSEKQLSQFLRQYTRLKKEALEIEEIIKAINPLLFANASKENDGMPRGSGTSNPTEAAYLKAEALVADYRGKQLACLEKMLEIEKIISGVENQTDRLILICRYINGRPWSSIAKELNYSISHIKRKNAKTLNMVLNDTFNCDIV